jgi:3-deoxy-D-manno-octulosonate 8-phosphate phosphatase (KDO 8-P phosphatase)
MTKEITSEQIASIELVVSDVDGVWTDGRLLLGDDGREIKVFHVRDGQAVHMAREAGIGFAILSGRTSKAVDRRARELKISFVVQGSRDKGIDFLQICADAGVPADRAAMVGDDIADLSAFCHAGISVAPADATPEVLDAADLVLKTRGGEGAVRELVERLLDARGLLTRRGAEARRKRP